MALTSKRMGKNMVNVKTTFLLGSALAAVMAFPGAVKAEDCTGTLPGADCTLDEDTTAALTIDSGVTLTIDSSVLLNHPIDGSAAAGDGSITTFGTVVIDQQADIGGSVGIEDLTITDDSTWNTSAAINTNNDGSDINLGAGDGGETLNFNAGSSYVGEIDGHSGDLVNFGADLLGGTYITGGQIEAVSITISSGTLNARNTLGSGVSLGDITISDGTTLIANENITSGNDLYLDGSLKIAADKTVTADTFVADADAGDITFYVDRTAEVQTAGHLNINSGGPVDLSNETIRIAVEADSQPLTNEVIDSVVLGNTAATIAPGTFIDDSYFYNFELVADGNDLDLSITRRSSATAGTSRNNNKLSYFLMSDLIDSSNPEINAIQSNLGNAPSKEAYNEILESAEPTVDRGYAMTSSTILNESNALIHNRISDVRTGRQTGISSGNPAKGSKVWSEIFVFSGEQDSVDSIDGYDIDGTGIAFGMDTGTMEEDLMWGLSVSAASTEVKSENANKTETEVETYGISAYGQYALDERTYLNGIVSWLHGNNEMTRNDVGGISGATAKAEFVTEHVSFYSGLERDYQMNNGVFVTPRASLQYAYLETDSYSEHGVEGANLSVDTDSLQSFEAGIGTDVGIAFENADGALFKPALHADYLFDFAAEEISMSSKFDGATGFFETQGANPQRHTFIIGTSAAYHTAESWEVSAHYDYTKKDSYTSHLGYIRGAYKF